MVWGKGWRYYVRGVSGYPAVAEGAEFAQGRRILGGQTNPPPRYRGARVQCIRRH